MNDNRNCEPQCGFIQQPQEKEHLMLNRIIAFTNLIFLLTALQSCNPQKENEQVKSPPPSSEVIHPEDSTAKGTDFRNFAWGATKESVQRLETIPLTKDEGDALVYKYTFYNKEGSLRYIFRKDELNAAAYTFRFVGSVFEDDKKEAFNGSLELFDSFRQSLSKKYSLQNQQRKADRETAKELTSPIDKKSALDYMRYVSFAGNNCSVSLTRSWGDEVGWTVEVFYEQMKSDRVYHVDKKYGNKPSETDF
ncbi:MAG: hypothetical protein KGJ59_09435 [Bacteroidota bacterium]|nr:hypothetical protein [Bacteroidota bacterium]